ncbi:MAG: ankyrin repeat domain-containing protein [Candidatus Burarchaeum sp.]|nr:ankyrin repeat domain-containing protein [Candidatus Burarchaeum sp.]MDO8340104.1 ankyrin repeat domain-containing protein [Candidatus Burarchaeum sp.]
MDKNGVKKVFGAIKAGNLDHLNELVVTKEDANVTNSQGMPALTFAIREHKTEAALFFIERGADVNKGFEDEEYTGGRLRGVEDAPIEDAVITDNVEVILALLNKGADPEKGIDMAEASGHYAMKGKIEYWVRRKEKKEELLEGEKKSPADVRKAFSTDDAGTRLKKQEVRIPNGGKKAAQ